jgi:predicted acylesterase/phospholipase RssA
MNETEPKHNYEFTKMVVAGGAIRTFASIGTIKYLEEQDLVKSIKHFVGTSAGSVICLFLVLGYTSNEIFEFILANFKRDEIASIKIEDVFQIINNYGLNLGANISTFVATMLHQKIKIKDITFLELAKHTGNNLVVCVANLTKQKEEYWSVDTTPHMSVIKAIKTSCSLPILFTPTKHNGDIYIDGGIYNNFPIHYFYDEVHTPNDSIKDIIGINITSSPPNNNDDFVSYISMLFHTIISRLVKPFHNSLQNNIVTIEFNDDDGAWIPTNGLQVDVTKEMLEKYTTIGYKKMKDLLITS